MAVISAYLDESENIRADGSAHVFAIGGYVAFPSDFSGLADGWKRIVDERLRPLGIKRFHMSAFESADKGFEQLTVSERHALLRDLINIVHGCEIQPVVAVLDMQNWHDMPKSQRDNFRTPFFPLMQSIVHLISSRVKTSDNDPRFQFVFDTRDDVVKGCEIAYEKMKEHLPQLLDVPAFVSNEHVPELQAADILAYDYCKAFRNKLAGDSRVRTSTKMLNEKRKVWDQQVVMFAEQL